MKGIPLPPLRIAALDRMNVLRVPFTKQASRVNSCPWEYLDWKMVWIDPGLGNGPYLKVSAKDGETVHRVYPRMEAGERYVKEAWAISDLFAKPFSGGETGPRFMYVGKAKEEHAAWVIYRTDYPGQWNGAWRHPNTMPEWAARYLITLGPPVPCRLGEVDVVQQRDEGVIIEIGDEYRRTWDALYPRHPYSPDLWTWGYPMEVRRR